MKSVIVTGATSFIGVHLIKELLKQNYKVYAVVRPNSKNIERLPRHDNLVVLEVELSDTKDIISLISDKVFAFYHLAWEGARAPYRDDKTMQDKNYQAALDAFQVASKLEAKIFIGSGSQAEYGKFNGVVDENYPCDPITEYGKAKYAAYKTLAKASDEIGMRFIWTRIFSVYGQYDYDKTLVMSCMDKMQRNEAMDMTECIQNWDFIYVEDVADALVKFLDVECDNGVYNVASGRPRQLKYFVEEMKEILQSETQITYGAVPYGMEGPVSFEPNVQKLENALCWKAKTSFAEGIQMLKDKIAKE